MKKISAFAAAFCLAVLPSFTASAAGAGPEQLKKMSVYLSNFTETGLFDFAPRRGIPESERYDLISFAVLHNVINADKKIKECPDKGCKWGELVIDASVVKETLERYLDWRFEKMPSFDSREDGLDIFHFDGKRYHFAAGAGEEVLYARVKTAEQEEGNGIVIMKGDICNAEDEKDVRGTFTAEAREHEWKGKKTWALIRLESVFKD